MKKSIEKRYQFNFIISFFRGRLVLALPSGQKQSFFHFEKPLERYRPAAAVFFKCLLEIFLGRLLWNFPAIFTGIVDQRGENPQEKILFIKGLV